MRTLDLSPAMIGRTIRIEREGIVGTHNYIEGTLQDFEFEVEDLGSIGHPRSTGHDVIGLTATIAGLEINLTGNEQLTIVEQK